MQGSGRGMSDVGRGVTPGLDSGSDLDRMPQWRGRAQLRSFTVVLVAVLTALTVAVFVLLGARTESLVRGSAIEQARSYTDLIVAARAWNSKHGGVYVKKSETVLTNPYLASLGIDADGTLADGTPVTLRNPAAMTREIGEQLVADRAASVFKLTSLEPVNPSNAPDAWERQGLQEFERGGAEYSSVQVSSGGVEELRYMRSLLVDASCLECHASSGYEIGDIRGAISVKLPYAASAAAVTSNRVGLLIVGLGILLGLWVLVFGLVRWLQGRLRKANRQLEYLATTDALTGLWNRRQTFESLAAELERAARQERGLGVLMVDIDHFKRVNDVYGHAAGDEVLRAVTEVLRQTVRTYDTVGRIGGEEMLIVAPGVDEAQLEALGERIRAAVERIDRSGTAARCAVTVSVGTALAPPGSGESADSLVARADGALYQAKNGGRNRVVQAV